MIVRDLKKLIEDLPDLMEVVVKQVDDEYGISPLETVEVRKCTFADGD